MVSTISAEERLIDCEKRIQYKFNRLELLKEALTHSSYAESHLRSNERLEFLGDATLGFVISNVLFSKFPQLEEGELSKIKSSVISRKTCKKVATRLELEKSLFIGKGLKFVPDSLISNVMEAVIGAIFLDGGFEEARLFVEENFAPEIEAFFNEENSLSFRIEKLEERQECDKRKIDVEIFDSNYKAKLQTKVQRENPNILPVYILLDEKGPSHSRCFKIAVKIGDRQFQAAWGSCKKATEQLAAENAYYQLQGLLPPHSDGE